VLRGRAAVLQLVISALALGGVVWWASKQSLPKLPSASEAAGPLVASLGLYALATLLRGERWRGILGVGGVDAGRADAYALTAVGYMGNNALPARAGDLMKAVISANVASAPRRDAFGALVAERLLDVVALVAIFGAVVLLGGLPLGLSPVTLALLAGALTVAAAAVVLLTPRLRGLLAALLAPSRAMLGRHGAALLGISLAVWLCEGGVYSILGSVSGFHFSLPDGLYIMALANIAAMVPAAPGYVGTYDAAVLLGVRVVGGTSRTLALPYVVLVRFVLFVPIAVIGLVLLVARYGGLRTLRAARAEAPAT
jgi:uncharacterized membrane protein YbhN (UPF0104 family)